jgi:O-antigen/teichoic acid export membrane protein
MYLQYGGVDLKEINRNELKTGLFSFRSMMIAESIILIPLAAIYGDKIVLGFSLTILSMNMSSYFKNLYQAVGEFSIYGRILNITTIATFAVNMLLLFVFKTDNFFVYLLLYALVDGAIWIALEYHIRNFFKNTQRVRFSFLALWTNIRTGFFLLIGNFSNILLSSMDRWFVKLMMDSTQFAFYSFAVSMEGFLNVAITPITTTLYNYFCNHLERSSVIRVRRYVTIFGSVIVAAAFPAKFIVEVFLKSYRGSINVLFILFATQVIYVVIKGVYVNLYKATRRQTTYFVRLLFILVIGAILNYSFVKLYTHIEAFAYGTLVSSLIWMIISIIDFKEYGFEIREGLYIILDTVIYIFLGTTLNSIVGFLIYILSVVVLLLIFMRSDVIELIRLIKTTLFKKERGST